MLSLATALLFAVETIPFEIVNNSQFADADIYVALVGRQNGSAVWFDFAQSTQSAPVTRPINTSWNTIHKTTGDWGYANIFTPLNKIAGKIAYMPKLSACRIFYAFKSPMYIHFFDDGGYAGADLQNPGDPNYGIRWELIEFTWADNGLWVNTSRVDAFQYPMGVELWGAAGANVGYAKAGEVLSYSELMNKWESQLGSDADFAACKEDVISTDKLGGIIEQPTKLQSFKEGGASANYYQNYIDQIWSYFSNHQLACDQGERGVWRGQVSGNVFTMTGELGAFNGVTATISGKPTTQEIIEGKGVMAQGNENDKALQAQFCGAIARGAIDLSVPSGQVQYWGDASKYYKSYTYNKYAAFFHQTDVSYNSKTYAFSYDDTFDQSSTLVTSIPSKVKVTIGGFTGIPGGDEGGGDDEEEEGEEGGGESSDPSGTGTTKEGLQYSYNCEYSAGDLTVTFTCTNASSYVGLVPVLFCNSCDADSYETIGAAGPTVTKVFPASVGDTFRFKGKWMYAGGDTVTDEIEYTVNIPTDGCDDVEFDVCNLSGDYYITDMLGRVIKNGASIKDDYNKLPAGMYIVRVAGKSLKIIKR